MTTFDLVLLLIIGGFVAYGLWFGLIHTLGVLVGTIAGAFLSARWYDDFASWLGFLFGGRQNVAKVVCFLFLFIIINRLVGLLFWVADKMFYVLAIIPFLKTINRLLGAILGFLEGVLVLGLTLYVAMRFPLGEWFVENLANSKVTNYLVSVAKILKPLLPEILKQIKSSI